MSWSSGSNSASGNNTSWTSRFSNLGRFSPFARSPYSSISGPSGGAPTVNDADFSYITTDDLRAHQAASVAEGAVNSRHLADSPVGYGPPRDTDTLVFSNRRNKFTAHFPAYSIEKGELTIGQVREQAARKLLGGDDVSASAASRVKLLYKGRNMKDDGRRCKDERLQDGSEILVTLAEVEDRDEAESSESGADDEEGGQSVAGAGAKKRRNRGKKSKRRNRREAASNQDSGASTPDRREPPAPQPPVPTTPLEKLAALHNTLQTFRSEVEAYISKPPEEAKAREFEYKRLSEMILTQVLLKTDGVETDGDVEARAKRKELVRETQDLLSRLDAVAKAGRL